ncbi:MAG: ribonuclease HII [Minisyncoccia bacterium]
MVPKYIIGIDEVGRGSLAGPLMVCGVIIPRKFLLKSEIKLRDSKKLLPHQRIKLFHLIKDNINIIYQTSLVSSYVIDKINISRAANLAAARVILSLYKNYPTLVKQAKIYCDGGLDINLKILKKYNLNFDNKIKVLIKADEKINAVKIASIVAKVKRDNLMMRLHEQYPVYYWDKNKGYGTIDHRKSIIKYGISKFHRLTFVKNYINLKSTRS